MSSKRFYRIKIRSLAAFVLSGLLLFMASSPQAVHAAELANRTVQISSSFASEIVTHAYSFSTAGPSTISSIGFLYCTNSPLHGDPCTAPAGLDVSATSIASEIGLTGFSLSASTNTNTIAITRAPAAEPATAAALSFDTITNPSTPNQTVFIRISIYDAPDLGGTRVDRGSVAFVTEDPYAVQAFVPPFLIFCVGLTVALDCSSTTGALVALGELNTNEPTAGTSQLSAATNDGTGYNLFMDGETMTSGNNIIPALGTQSGSVPGTSQFGVNLRANSSPSVGTDPDSGAVANGFPDPQYNTPNLFRFVDGDRIALSPNSTGFNRYTVSYLVNISEDQAPGQYAATFTYTAIASF